MKGKMKGKMKGVLLIAVFILSTIAIAIPAFAEDSEYELTEVTMLEIVGDYYPVDVTVVDTGPAIKWTFDMIGDKPLSDDDLISGGKWGYGLVISLDGIEADFQIHNNDGTDATYPWGTHLYSEYYDGSWHSGDENTLVDELSWVTCTGDMYILDNPTGIFTITIDKTELSSKFYWSAWVGVGGFWTVGGYSSYPEGFIWDDTFEELISTTSGESVVVDGDGYVASPEAGTTVTYTGADDDTIIVQDLSEDDVEEATFGAVGEYVDVKLEEGSGIDELWVTIHYDDTGMEWWEEEELIMYWYDGTNWAVCSDYEVDTEANTLTAYVNDVDTSPLISQMTGTPFGPGSGMALDADYYHTGDTVTVMLGAAPENEDTEVIETVAVYAVSETDSFLNTIALVETDVDTGVFSGTFTLVGISPGSGELLVSTGDHFSVLYFGDGMEEDPTLTVGAIVDDTAPIVVLTAPADTVLFETGSVTISATIDEDNPVDVVIRADGSTLLTELYAGPTVETTWDTSAELVVDVPLFPDGVYTISVTATDAAGNYHSDSTTLTVDNTGPTVTNATASPTIIGLNVLSNITLTATVEDAGIGNISSVTVDCSDIGESASLDMTDPDLDGVYNASLTNVLVDVEDTYYLNITAIDELSNANLLGFITLEVIDDIDGPTDLSLTEVDPISGGMILKGFSAVDALTGVVSYDILEDGASWMSVTVEDLAVTTWTPGTPVVFNNMVVLDGHAGETVNVTLIAYDQVGNPSEELILYEGVIPDGEWAPISLYAGWNLVSLPLIPASSDSGDILSLILDQGASGVTVSYGYDHVGDTWITNPAEMTDGYGYWLYMNEDDVLIVEGTETLPAPSSPQTYEYTEGWVLAGYKQLGPSNITDYCTSFEENSYFTTVYVWNAVGSAWDTISDPDELSAGQGFWLFLYSDQSLIAPLEGP